MLFIWIIAGSYITICLFMFFFQRYFIFFPEKLEADYQFHFPRHLNWEEVWVENDSIRLNTLHFKANSSKKVILYFHGNAGALNSWGNVAEDFLPFGWDLFIIDYRGFGKSEGKTSHKGLLADGQAVYDYLLKSYSEDQIIVYGRSLGSGIAAHIASNNSPSKLILETPYTSLVDLSKHYYKWLPVKWLHRFPLTVEQNLPNISCPIYMIHGSHDEVIPVSNSQYLAQTFPQKIKLYIEIEQGKHNNLSEFREFQDFLMKIR